MNKEDPIISVVVSTNPVKLLAIAGFARFLDVCFWHVTHLLQCRDGLLETPFRHRQGSLLSRLGASTRYAGCAAVQCLICDSKKSPAKAQWSSGTGVQRGEFENLSSNARR